jgi:hypothetical protein
VSGVLPPQHASAQLLIGSSPQACTRLYCRFRRGLSVVVVVVKRGCIGFRPLQPPSSDWTAPNKPLLFGIFPILLLLLLLVIIVVEGATGGGAALPLGGR